MKWRLLFTVIILLGWIGVAYWFGSYTLGSPDRTSPVTMEILPKSSLKEIGASLKERNVIRESYFFRTYAILSGNSNLKPGVYEIQPSESLDQILRKFSQGRQDLVRIILPPGFTALKVGERLAAHGYSKDLFLKLMNEKKPKYDFERKIPIDTKRTYRLEGYLVPGTYYFKKDEHVEDIINEMLQRFATYIDTQKINERIRTNPNLPSGLTLDQIVAVASLIEREAQVKDELPTIAGVIYNRMRNPQNNRLRIDASIVYIYGFKGINLNSVTQKQIIDTKHNPYNTYHHAGLPPGPIACPGTEAIIAAINPQEHNYEYYVTKKDGSKRHYFTRTYEDHQRYDRQSQENEKNLRKR